MKARKININIVRYKQILRFTIIILLPTFFVTLFSCSRLKRKGHDTYNKTKEVVIESKQKINRKTGDFLDSVILKPSVETPNTPRDKKRFREYLLSEIPEDVKNIYSYGDFFGADYKVLIAFSCNASTIDKIVALKKMKQATKKNDGGLYFMDEFTWWKKEKIQLLEPYIVGKEYEYWKYIWYDPKTRQAYYEEFSL